MAELLLSELLERLQHLELAGRERVPTCNCFARINSYGDKLYIALSASERYHPTKAYWSDLVDLRGETNEVENLLDQAEAWVYSIPTEENRAVQLMVQKLHKLVEEIPDSDNPAIDAAWEGLKRALLAQAEKLGRNGLPRPRTE